jgi:prepilin signal peptidase PulO-like enzyme (type II secretory pathway)
MIPLIALLFLIFGLIIGSFLNVVIFRLNTGHSLGGRSACMTCQHKLKWHELIPLISFIALRGRCRSCKSKISIQYPLVELAAGVIFCAIFLKFQDILLLNKFQFALTYAYYAFIFAILIVITAYDLMHKIIPDTLVYAFGALAFVGLFFFAANNFPGFSGVSPFYPHIPASMDFFSGIFIALPFTLLWLVSGGEWIGLGDAKIALGIGWLLGFSGALSALGLAFISGAIVGLCLIVALKNYGMKSEIPFALYLVFGTLLVFLFNLRILPV